MLYDVSCEVFGKAVHFSKKDTIETVLKKIIAILEVDKVSDVCLKLNTTKNQANILNIVFSVELNGIKEDRNWSSVSDSFWVVRTNDDKSFVKVISDTKFKESWKNISGVLL